MLPCHYHAYHVITVPTVQHGTVTHGSATVKNLCPDKRGLWARNTHKNNRRRGMYLNYEDRRIAHARKASRYSKHVLHAILHIIYIVYLASYQKTA